MNFSYGNKLMKKFSNKQMPGYFFLALETWNSADDSANSNPLVETIFADTIIYWRNLVLNKDKNLSSDAEILLENVGIALKSVPGD